MLVLHVAQRKACSLRHSKSQKSHLERASSLKNQKEYFKITSVFYATRIPNLELLAMENNHLKTCVYYSVFF